MNEIINLKAFKTEGDAEKFRLTLKNPDQYGLFCNYMDADLSLWCPMAKVVMQLICAAATELPRRQWVGLTDDEIYRIAFELEGEHWKKIAIAIEAKIKEKNT